jgi:NhaP-type Na+/H+ or K+/H+ antiporter
LVTGIILGPVTGFFNPDQFFGPLLFPLISLAVAVILFEGSLTLKFSEIRGQHRYILRFIFVGGAITWLGISFTTHAILHIDWSLSALIGAMLVVTGPTVIIPMLRSIRPQSNIAQMLRWEGIISDPFGALLAVLVFEVIASNQLQDQWLHTVLYFIKMVVSGTSLGLVSGVILSQVLSRHWLPNFLINIVVLNSVLGVFVLANLCYSETGLLAVTVMGLTLANYKTIDLSSILDFKETLSTLLISNIFIVLAARLNFASLLPILIPTLLLFLVMQFVIRPAKVMLTTIGSNLEFRQKLFLSWIAPRGIVAAAIISLFEIKLTNMGFPGANILTPLVFIIIVLSVVLPSFTGTLLAKFLKVNQPDANGVLIIGANFVAREIAKILIKNNVYVLLADSNWVDISEARLEGLTTFYGNPVSEHADYNLSLMGIGRLLSITPNIELGVLAGLRFRKEFGKKEIYYLQTEQEKTSKQKYLVAKQHRGTMLFNQDITYEELERIMRGGSDTRSTSLSEVFDNESYAAMNKHRYIPIFAFNSRHNLVIFTSQKPVKPEAGWTIIAIHPMESNEKKSIRSDYVSADTEAK